MQKISRFKCFKGVSSSAPFTWEDVELHRAKRTIISYDSWTPDQDLN